MNTDFVFQLKVKKGVNFMRLCSDPKNVHMFKSNYQHLSIFLHGKMGSCIVNGWK